MLRIAPDAVVSKDVEILGNNVIEIGARCVVHPRCRLDATYGDIIIGAGCILEELVIVQ